jgi:hypothetical protein
MVHTALSQDIVVHETTHALIDGIARDLYDAVDPHSLAIHESVADVTASMVSLRNRERIGQHTPEASMNEITRSSRYSRVAEEFGRSRGDAPALRDAVNHRTLHPRTRRPDRAVDPGSPHSLSEVMTGALFAVLVRSISTTQPRPLKDNPFREAAVHGINRVASMMFKGLDWLPPGDVTLADYARAMLAADRFHHPERPDEREWLVEECVRRWIGTRRDLADRAGVDALDIGPVDGERVVSDRRAARRFVATRRDLIGVPPGPIDVEARWSVRSDAPLLDRLHLAEGVPLDRLYREPADAARVVVLKVSWWAVQPVALAPSFSDRCDVKRGATVVMDERGRVQVLLRGGAGAPAVGRRAAFLRRLADAGVLARDHALGPDGEPLRGMVQTTVDRGVLRVSGPFQALHIA